MAYTYELSTNIGKVRLKSMDKFLDDSSKYIFTDEEIESFLDLENDSVLRAAAAVVEAIAQDENLVKGKIKLLDLQLDATVAAKEMRAYAKSLRQQADENEDFEIDFAEMADNTFAQRSQLRRDRLDE